VGRDEILGPVFHVELRQFPHSTRAFNLSLEQLQRQILGPWLAGEELQLEDRRWSPQKAKLTIYEAPELAVGEMGLGRGWANVTRGGSEVTSELLAAASEVGPPAALQEFKRRVIDRCEAGGVPIDDIMRLAGELHPDWRPSERLGLCEQAVWELLHQRRLRMLSPSGPVDKDQWQGVVLGWSSWTGESPWQARLESI
jgi:hypothetical protein